MHKNRNISQKKHYLTNYIYEFFYNPASSFEARKFNIMAFSAIFFNIMTCILYLIAGQADFFLSTLIRIGIIILEIIITSHFKIYKLFYYFTIVCFYCCILPSIFINHGGVGSGILPVYAYSIANTIIMLNGLSRILLILTEISVYIYTFFYYYDFSVNKNIEVTLSASTVLPAISCGIALGVTAILCIKNYQLQTERIVKAKEDSDDAIAQKIAFFSNISHELNTPVTTIMGMNETIFRESSSSAIRGYAKNSLESGETLQKLINNLLTNNQTEILTTNKEETEIELSHINSFAPFTAPDAHILIVDDNQMNLKVISLLLKKIKITIDTAISGKDALFLLDRKKYDIIFLDYMMPEMNGIDLLNRIKAEYSSIFDSTPIFAFSADTTNETKELLHKNGFSGFIPKPVNESYLEKIIRENIPNKLIIDSEASDNTTIIDNDILNKYRDLLLKYDISIDDGIFYSSNNFEKYVFFSKLYADNYESNIMTIKKNENDLEKLSITFHSVKSNSRQLGAMSLYELARTAELKCYEGNEKFVAKALPLFYYEYWGIVQGLHVFFASLSENGEEYFGFNPSCTYDMSEEDYVNKLFDLISSCEHKSAISLIDYVLNNHIDDKNLDKLTCIRTSVDQLDYEESLLILKELTN